MITVGLLGCGRSRDLGELQNHCSDRAEEFGREFGYASVAAATSHAQSGHVHISAAGDRKRLGNVRIFRVLMDTVVGFSGEDTGFFFRFTREGFGIFRCAENELIDYRDLTDTDVVQPHDGPGRDVDLFLHLAGGLDEFFAKRDLRECSYTHNNKIFSRKKNTLCMGRGRRNGCCLDNDIRRLFEECSKVRVRSCAELPAELLCTFKNHIIYCSDFEVLLILCDHVTDISAP